MKVLLGFITGFIMGGVCVWLIIRFKLGATAREADDTSLKEYIQLLKENSPSPKQNEESLEDSESTEA